MYRVRLDAGRRGPQLLRQIVQSINSFKDWIAALEITFSSSRTFPGHACCNKIVCARRVRP